jgi:predicted dinucleotide-utilizing enzyme
MAGGLKRLDVFIDLGAGEASEPELLFEGTAREVGLRFPEGVNVVISAALAGPGLDAAPRDDRHRHRVVSGCHEIRLDDPLALAVA